MNALMVEIELEKSVCPGRSGTPAWRATAFPWAGEPLDSAAGIPGVGTAAPVMEDDGEDDDDFMWDDEDEDDFESEDEELEEEFDYDDDEDAFDDDDEDEDDDDDEV